MGKRGRVAVVQYRRTLKTIRPRYSGEPSFGFWQGVRTMNNSSHKAIERAERSVIRAAMGIVNSDGWAFQTEPMTSTTDQPGKNIVLFPGAMRRLEAAIARLKQARKEAKPRRRKYTCNDEQRLRQATERSTPSAVRHKTPCRVCNGTGREMGDAPGLVVSCRGPCLGAGYVDSSTEQKNAG